eukprot:14497707-Ditylum_brightwellii.AAC.1
MVLVLVGLPAEGAVVGAVDVAAVVLFEDVGEDVGCLLHSGFSDAERNLLPLSVSCLVGCCMFDDSNCSSNSNSIHSRSVMQNLFVLLVDLE